MSWKKAVEAICHPVLTTRVITRYLKANLSKIELQLLDVAAKLATNFAVASVKSHQSWDRSEP